MLDFYRPFQGQDAIMKHNNAMGANTMYFPIGKIARGTNTMVKKKHIQNDILNIGRAYYANTAGGFQSIPYDLTN